jgi:hypothetical protein
MRASEFRDIQKELFVRCVTITMLGEQKNTKRHRNPLDGVTQRQVRNVVQSTSTVVVIVDDEGG